METRGGGSSGAGSGSGSGRSRAPHEGGARVAGGFPVRRTAPAAPPRPGTASPGTAKEMKRGKLRGLLSGPGSLGGVEQVLPV